MPLQLLTFPEGPPEPILLTAEIQQLKSRNCECLPTEQLKLSVTNAATQLRER